MGDDDVLVKVVAVAQNPADWKCTTLNSVLLLSREVNLLLTVLSMASNVGTVLGCDWSGHVVGRGKNVETPDLDAHIAGMSIGGTFSDCGAFAEYVKMPAELTWTVPDGRLTHEDAATVSAG